MKEGLDRVKDEVDTFLLGDSADEREQRYLILKILALEVLYLKLLLRFQVSPWSFSPQYAQPLIFPYAIGEGERVRMFPKYGSQWRFLQEVIFIRMRYSTPIIASLESTSGGIYYDFIVAVFDIPVRGELDEPVEISLFDFGVESALVEGIEVMTDMHEFGSVKYLAVALALDVGADEAAHPVVVDDDGWEDLQLAEGLECDQCEEH